MVVGDVKTVLENTLYLTHSYMAKNSQRYERWCNCLPRSDWSWRGARKQINKQINHSKQTITSIESTRMLSPACTRTLVIGDVASGLWSGSVAHASPTSRTGRGVASACGVASLPRQEPKAAPFSSLNNRPPIADWPVYTWSLYTKLSAGRWEVAVGGWDANTHVTKCA